MIRDIYGFEPFNRSRGLKITEERTPEATYHIPEGEFDVYSHEPSIGDLIHPFRPSGNIIIEVSLNFGSYGHEMFLAGDDEQFEELDKDILNRLEEDRSPEYFKKILQ